MDIADKNQLLSYLAEKDVFPAGVVLDVVYFDGGVSGVVALASDGKREIVVKQALPKLRVEQEWLCPAERIIIEHKATELYRRIVPELTPEPLFADEENNVICRQAAPRGSAMWKRQLLDGLIDFRVGERVARALARVHGATMGDPAVARTFADNRVFHELRISPYIEKAVEAHPATARLAEKVIARLMNEKRVLVHGDFSPKNIMIDGADIYILDHEVAHFGHPSFDLAFFFNHFILKAVKNKRWRDAYLNLLLHQARTYFGSVSVLDGAALEKETVELLCFMLLARVDGKSPAEYLRAEEDKAEVRAIAYGLLEDNASRIEECIAVVQRIVALR